MKTLSILIVLLLGAPAWASTITFTPGEDTLDWTWTTWLTQPIQETVWQTNYGNTTPFPSAGYAMYNAYGINNLLLEGPAGTVEGFWVSPWMAFDTWYDPYSAHVMSIQGYTVNAGWTPIVEVPLTPGFQYVATGWTDPVSLLWLRTPGKYWYVIDDITMTVTPEARAQLREDQRLRELAATLPEPATWILLVLGLMVLRYADQVRRPSPLL